MNRKLKDGIIKIGSRDNFIDKSVSDGVIDVNLFEEIILRKIRGDLLKYSAVLVVLIGEETHVRPYINSEIQAELWSNRVLH